MEDTNVWHNSNMIDHIHYFIRKIKNREPFSLIRPSDGEYLILKKNEFKTQDNWTNVPGVLDDDLYNAIKNAADSSKVYIGIPCHSCMHPPKSYQGDMYNYYTQEFKIPKKRLTYANVLCNRNFRIFINFLIENKIAFNYIGPGTEKCEILKVIKRFKTDELLVDNWKEQKETFKNELYKWIYDNIDSSDVFMFSVGPISKIIIPELAIKYPHKTFIDAGSTLDLFLKGSTNRIYLNENQPCFNECCSHTKGHNENPEITVILTGYKRPQHFNEQIKSIKNQTIKAKEIILWVNNPDFDFGDTNLQDVTVIKSNKNFGVWARFSCALLANTKYVCVFDDDTIPGNRWFENCYETMKQFDGLLGTIGVVFNENSQFYDVKYRIGWDKPINEVSKVDIVGHSWFFKKEWLQYLWKLQPIFDENEQLVCGEDIGFSCALQKVGIDTFVPPHPPGHHEFFGSIPEKAWSYGTENVGVSMQHDASNKFSKALNYYRKEYGFKLRD